MLARLRVFVVEAMLFLLVCLFFVRFFLYMFVSLFVRWFVSLCFLSSGKVETTTAFLQGGGVQNNQRGPWFSL